MMKAVVMKSKIALGLTICFLVIFNQRDCFAQQSAPAENKVQQQSDKGPIDKDSIDKDFGAERYERLEKRILELEKKIEAKHEQEEKDSGSEEKLSLWKLPDWVNQLKPFGLLQMDVGFFHQNRKNQLQVGDAADGAEVRRARLGVKARHSELLTRRYHQNSERLAQV